VVCAEGEVKGPTAGVVDIGAMLDDSELVTPAGFDGCGPELGEPQYGVEAFAAGRKLEIGGSMWLVLEL
jgi:hypothetical protein